MTNPMFNIVFWFNINRGDFKTKVNGRHVGIFDLLGDAFVTLSKVWLKANRKHKFIPSEYWDIAMLCSKYLHCIIM